MTTPPDLSAYRDKFRLRREPLVPGIWGLQIVCKRGHICPWAEGRIAACTNKRGPIVKRLEAIPDANMEMDGDDGVNVSFPVQQIHKVARAMGARRKKQISPEQREQLLERLQKGSKQ